jgi:hypothetical protein
MALSIEKRSAERRLLFAITLAGIMVMGAQWPAPTPSLSEIYTWKDSHGVLHFSDDPPERQVAPRGAGPETKESFEQQAKQLALRWKQVGGNGKRCNSEEVRRVERLYTELMIQARQELQLCRDGRAGSCRLLGVPASVSILDNNIPLQHYLPPDDIKRIPESGFKNGSRRRVCQS